MTIFVSIIGIILSLVLFSIIDYFTFRFFDYMRDKKYRRDKK